jgi:hypothetical protein
MTDPLSTCWFETKTGTRYEMPDMVSNDIDATCKQFDDNNITTITAANISNAILVLPRHILAKAGTGNRCFWEAPCTKLNPPGEFQKD